MNKDAYVQIQYCSGDITVTTVIPLTSEDAGQVIGFAENLPSAKQQTASAREETVSQE